MAMPDRREQPVPKRFAATLGTATDLKLVRWVAGQVKLWPPEKAASVLQEAQAARQAAGQAEAARIIKEAE